DHGAFLPFDKHAPLRLARGGAPVPAGVRRPRARLPADGPDGLVRAHRAGSVESAARGRAGPLRPPDVEGRQDHALPRAGLALGGPDPAPPRRAPPGPAGPLAPPAA